MALRRVFLEDGFEVELAAGIAEAEALLARSPFTVVVLDRQLPDGDSITLLHKLTSGHYARPIPVLMLSGAETLEARLDALRFGGDFVAKPYDEGFVLSRVRMLAGLPAAERSGGRPCRVLVIDDSATYGNAVVGELRSRGHDVVLAATAADGLRYLTLQQPERVLVDVFLPDADGIDIARRVRDLSSASELPVLLLTGRESATTRKRALQAGVTAFLTKDSPLAVVGAWVWQPTRSGLEGPNHAGPPSGTVERTPLPRRSPRPSIADGLFDRLVASSGLSLVLGRSVLGLALHRCGVEPDRLTSEGLTHCLEQIEKTLNTFLPADNVGKRMSSIAQLARENRHAVTAK